jgi:chemotaxis protein MotA
MTYGPEEFKKVRSASLITLMFAVIFFAGFTVTDGTPGQRLFIMLGGDLKNSGYIQILTIFCFIWAILDVDSKIKELKTEKNAFNLSIFSQKSTDLISHSELSELYDKILKFEKSKSSLLTNVIKNAIIKFQLGKSIADVIEIISIQVENSYNRMESRQSKIRYLIWTIPSLGFVGTVIGISSALAIANSSDVNLVTGKLGVAFDTTLVSLILSIIIMFFYHGLQEENDRLHVEVKEYAIRNLVNKIKADENKPVEETSMELELEI